MNRLLEVKNLSIDFRFGDRDCSVVDSVSFDIAPGEVLALVGESGCGKSLSCLALTGLLPPGAHRRADAMRFTTAARETVELSTLPPRRLRRIRGGEIAYIFQEPSASLNPVFRVGDQIAEAIALHCPDEHSVAERVASLLRDVGIPEPERRARAYPHELSGGMQQRVMIALALAGNPSLLIADEPTTALDVTIQAQILELLVSLSYARKMAILLVTHNLGIVAQVADRVAVMYAGRVVETAPTATLLNAPLHPYTRALLRAVPRLNAPVARLATIPGQVPEPRNFPAGCRFSNRCALAIGRCRNEVPPATAAEGDPAHLAACFRAGEEEPPEV